MAEGGTILKLQAQAELLISKGFEIAPIFGIGLNNYCLCRNSNCFQVGKHLYNITNKNFGTKSIDELKNNTRFHHNFNIAVMTGRRSGLVIVDVDLPALENGEFKNLSKNVPEFENTFSVRTGSGGIHFYFKTDERYISKTNQFGPNIDFLAENCYAISVGSIHKNGKKYSILNDTVTLSFPKFLAKKTYAKEVNMKKIT